MNRDLYIISTKKVVENTSGLFSAGNVEVTNMPADLLRFYNYSLQALRKPLWGKEKERYDLAPEEFKIEYENLFEGTEKIPSECTEFVFDSKYNNKSEYNNKTEDRWSDIYEQLIDRLLKQYGGIGEIYNLIPKFYKFKSDQVDIVGVKALATPCDKGKGGDWIKALLDVFDEKRDKYNRYRFIMHDKDFTEYAEGESKLLNKEEIEALIGNVSDVSIDKTEMIVFQHINSSSSYKLLCNGDMLTIRDRIDNLFSKSHIVNALNILESNHVFAISRNRDKAFDMIEKMNLSNDVLVQFREMKKLLNDGNSTQATEIRTNLSSK